MPQPPRIVVVGSANVAEVHMVCRVGDDLFGPATIENLEAWGIDCTHVQITPGVSSGVAPYSSRSPDRFASSSSRAPMTG